MALKATPYDVGVKVGSTLITVAASQRPSGKIYQTESFLAYCLPAEYIQFRGVLNRCKHLYRGTRLCLLWYMRAWGRLIDLQVCRTPMPDLSGKQTHTAVANETLAWPFGSKQIQRLLETADSTGKRAVHVHNEASTSQLR